MDTVPLTWWKDAVQHSVSKVLYMFAGAASCRYRLRSFWGLWQYRTCTIARVAATEPGMQAKETGSDCVATKEPWEIPRQSSLWGHLSSGRG